MNKNFISSAREFIASGKKQLIDFIPRNNLVILSVQFIGLLLIFCSNLMMTRLFGEKAYGVYSLLTNWASVLAVAGLFGMDNSHLNKVPVFRLKEKYQAIKYQLKWSLGVNLIALIIVLAVFYIISYKLKLSGLADHLYYIKFAMVILCLIVVINNLLCFLRSLGKVLWCEIIDKLGRQTAVLIFLITFYISSRTNLIKALLYVNILSFSVILIALILVINKVLKQFNQKNENVRERFSIKPNIHYLFLSILYLLSVRADILLLSIYSDPVIVGHYNIVIKFSDIISYPLSVANLSLPLLLAQSQHRNNGLETPGMLNKISKSVFFQSLALSLILAVTGYYILGWYGQGFRSAYPALCVLCLSNLISAYSASIDVFYILNKKEKKVIACRIFSILLFFIIGFTLIPVYGMSGAVLSTFIGNLTYCVLLQYLFYKEYGFIVHPFHRQLDQV